MVIRFFGICDRWNDTNPMHHTRERATETNDGKCKTGVTKGKKLKLMIQSIYDGKKWIYRKLGNKGAEQRPYCSKGIHLNVRGQGARGLFLHNNLHSTTCRFRNLTAYIGLVILNLANLIIKFSFWTKKTQNFSKKAKKLKIGFWGFFGKNGCKPANLALRKHFE